MIIGLTGGIASGKSYVAGILRELGAEIIDADEIYRGLIQPGAPLHEKIVSLWGTEVIASDGSIDRKRLGSIIFSSDEERKKLNALTHPLIIEAIKEQLGNRRGKIAVLMAPLLIEAGQQHLVDELWFVSLDEEKQITRLIERDNLTGDDARRRIHAQMSQEEKMKSAHYIIDNSGTPESTKTQVTDLWKKLQGRGIHGTA